MRQKRQKAPKWKGRLYTAPQKQMRVIARRIAGQRKGDIAKAEDLDRGTVRRILWAASAFQ